MHIVFFFSILNHIIFVLLLAAMANDTPPEALIPQLLPPTLLGVAWAKRDNTDLTRVVYHESRVNRPDNTSIAYDPKVAEFCGYCNAMYRHTGVNIRYQVTPEKVYNFLFYQSHREKKKQVKLRKERGRRPVSFLLPTTKQYWEGTQIKPHQSGSRQLTQYSFNR
jgi:hypothetical protein